MNIIQPFTAVFGSALECQVSRTHRTTTGTAHDLPGRSYPVSPFPPGHLHDRVMRKQIRRVSDGRSARGSTRNHRCDGHSSSSKSKSTGNDCRSMESHAVGRIGSSSRAEERSWMSDWSAVRQWMVPVDEAARLSGREEVDGREVTLEERERGNEGERGGGDGASKTRRWTEGETGGGGDGCGGEEVEVMDCCDDPQVTASVSRTKDWSFLTLNFNSRSSSEVRSATGIPDRHRQLFCHVALAPSTVRSEE